MANLYKLTNENGMTRANTTTELQWGVGVTHTAKIEGVRLCSNQVIHAYEHLPIALLIGPGTIKANKPRLWAAEGEIVAREGQLKCGVKTLTTVCEIPLPTITLEQRAKFAILCALEVYKEEDFVCWARKWLSREDRSKSKAQEAAKAADYTARAIRHYHKMQAQIEQQSLEEIAARCGALVASAAWAAKSASEAAWISQLKALDERVVACVNEAVAHTANLVFDTLLQQGTTDIPILHQAHQVVLFDCVVG